MSTLTPVVAGERLDQLDILLTYALIAFLMVLLFRRTPASRLPKWAIVFLLLPTLLMIGFTGLIALAPPDAVTAINQQFAADLAEARDTVSQATAIYASGTFMDATGQRLDDLVFLLESFLFWIPPILGFFLLGRWLIVTGRLAHPDLHVRFYSGALKLGFLVGLPLCMLGGWLMWEENLPVLTPKLALASACLAVGAPLLAFGYLALVVVNRRRLVWLAPAGRMALTNYLLQSLFWTWVIYGYGLGLGPDIPHAITPVLAVGFFALQIVASHIWLTRFRFGPLEWVWRCLTYLNLQPMRKESR